MEPHEYLALDATAMAGLVRAGQVTAAELAGAAGRRHDETAAAINAVVEWYPDPAAPASSDGPLAGVPFLRKDYGATEAGRLAEMGSRLAAGYRAPTTSPYFEAMVGAGVQVLGRTAVPEFAQHGTTETEVFGPTRNPVDLATSAGGSSGGAAAAVAAGVVPLAHASDAAGSIRIPAAVTGLLGLKTTRGLDPGSAGAWRGLLVEFVLARSVADLEACLAIFGAALDPGPAGPLRIAFSPEHWAGLDTDPEVAAAVSAFAHGLEAGGHRVETIGVPLDYEQLMTTWFPLFGGGVADAIDEVARLTGRSADGDHLEPNTLELLDRVAALGPETRATAAATAAAVEADLEAALARFDLLLTPTLDRAVIPLGRMAGTCPMDRYLADGDEWFDRLYAANVTGWPALSLPADVGGPGRPIGVQVMARPGREDLLLSVARATVGSLVIPARHPSGRP